MKNINIGNRPQEPLDRPVRFLYKKHIPMAKQSKVRQRILDTASRLFYQQGFNRTGIDQIIEEAQVAKASLYSHFRTKDELCQAYLQKTNEEWISILSEYLESLPPGEARILGLFDCIRKAYERDDFRGCWCVNTLAEVTENQKLIQEEIRTQKEDLTKYLRKLLEGNYPQKIPEYLVQQIYLLYQGAISESYLHQSDWPIEAAKALTKQLVKNLQK